ncbi:IS630 family transposase, partial [Endozoicomonas sp. SM1973]
RPRPGRPSLIDEATIQKVLTLTTERIPHESTHWSVQLMSKYAEISTWQVRQIWKAFDLKPHRIKTFKISNDPDFAEKVVDIVGLYMNPPTNAVVLSVDEKSQIQALDRTQPGLPLSPGKIGSRTHDYKRNGTVCLYTAFNVLTGEVTGKVTDNQRSKEFLSFLKQIEKKTPEGYELHVILDNLSAHKTPDVMKWVNKKPHLHFHFTPTSSSWLNAVEGWFAQLERRSLYRGVFTSVKELKDEIYRFISVHNRELAKPFKWVKSAKSIIASVERAKKLLPN